MAPPRSRSGRSEKWLDLLSGRTSPTNVGMCHQTTSRTKRSQAEVVTLVAPRGSHITNHQPNRESRVQISTLYKDRLEVNVGVRAYWGPTNNTPLAYLETIC
jgi:hypothetical protein